MKKVFEGLSDVDLLTLCIYGEARGEGLDGMLAVGSVVMNRAKRPGWWGRDVKSVILKPRQFSCLNDDDPNYSTLTRIAVDFAESLRRQAVLRRCHWIARGLIEGFLISNVGNATHYHTVGCDPSWDDDMRLIARIGRHEFFEVSGKKNKPHN